MGRNRGKKTSKVKILRQLEDLQRELSSKQNKLDRLERVLSAKRKRNAAATSNIDEEMQPCCSSSPIDGNAPNAEATTPPKTTTELVTKSKSHEDITCSGKQSTPFSHPESTTHVDEDSATTQIDNNEEFDTMSIFLGEEINSDKAQLETVIVDLQTDVEGGDENVSCSDTEERSENLLDDQQSHKDSNHAVDIESEDLPADSISSVTENTKHDHSADGKWDPNEDGPGKDSVCLSTEDVMPIAEDINICCSNSGKEPHPNGAMSNGDLVLPSTSGVSCFLAAMDDTNFESNDSVDENLHSDHEKSEQEECIDGDMSDHETHGKDVFGPVDDDGGLDNALTEKPEDNIGTPKEGESLVHSRNVIAVENVSLEDFELMSETDFDIENMPTHSKNANRVEQSKDDIMKLLCQPRFVPLSALVAKVEMQEQVEFLEEENVFLGETPRGEGQDPDEEWKETEETSDQSICESPLVSIEDLKLSDIDFSNEFDTSSEGHQHICQTRPENGSDDINDDDDLPSGISVEDPDNSVSEKEFEMSICQSHDRVVANDNHNGKSSGSNDEAHLNDLDEDFASFLRETFICDSHSDDDDDQDECIESAALERLNKMYSEENPVGDPSTRTVGEFSRGNIPPNIIQMIEDEDFFDDCEGIPIANIERTPDPRCCDTEQPCLGHVMAENPPNDLTQSTPVISIPPMEFLNASTMAEREEIFSRRIFQYFDDDDFYFSARIPIPDDDDEPNVQQGSEIRHSQTNVTTYCHNEDIMSETEHQELRLLNISNTDTVEDKPAEAVTAESECIDSIRPELVMDLIPVVFSDTNFVLLLTETEVILNVYWRSRWRRYTHWSFAKEGVSIRKGYVIQDSRVLIAGIIINTATGGIGNRFLILNASNMAHTVLDCSCVPLEHPEGPFYYPIEIIPLFGLAFVSNIAMEDCDKLYFNKLVTNCHNQTRVDSIGLNIDVTPYSSVCMVRNYPAFMMYHNGNLALWDYRDDDEPYPIDLGKRLPSMSTVVHAICDRTEWCCVVVVAGDDVPDDNVSNDDVPKDNVSNDDVPKDNVSNDDVPNEQKSKLCKFIVTSLLRDITYNICAYKYADNDVMNSSGYNSDIKVVVAGDKVLTVNEGVCRIFHLWSGEELGSFPSQDISDVDAVQNFMTLHYKEGCIRVVHF